MSDVRRPDALADRELERADRELALDAPLRARLPLDDKAGPAARISSARAAAMVDAALAAALAPGAPTTGVRARFEKLGPAARALALAAAVLLMFVGGAAAAKLVAWVLEERAASAPEPSGARVNAAARKPAAVQSQAAAPAQAIEAPAVEPKVAPEPASAKPAPRARERESVLEDVLQRANRERAAGRFREAASLYAQVYERDPRSMSAYVARVAAGSIELEHLARPARARALFEAALRALPGGALDLEARQGLALALRDLGARGEEAKALRALIAAHPQRPAAARARARLAELPP